MSDDPGNENDSNNPDQGDGREPGTDRRPPFTRDGEPTVVAGIGPAGPYNYRPGRVLVSVPPNASAPTIKRMVSSAAKVAGGKCQGVPSTYSRVGYVVIQLAQDADIPAIVSALRKAGFDASADVVYMIDAVTATPMHFAGGHSAAPMHFAGGYYAAPMHFAGKLVTDPMHFGRMSTARPGVPPSAPFNKLMKSGNGSATVVVIDTGFLTKPAAANDKGEWTPLSGGMIELPDPEDDDILDTAAGHNGFIQGIVNHGSPGTDLRGVPAIGNDGEASDHEVAVVLDRVLRNAPKTLLGRWILNLSFSGYYPDDRPPPAVAHAIRRFVSAGTVVVASAGNNSSCRPAFPAAMAEVVGVGSVGPCGPSWFSNHGSWVDASAPGEDVISEFFRWNGGFSWPVGTGLPDPDDFHGWAMWSGTSFSAPRVVAAMARQIQLLNCTAVEAKQIIIDRPGLFRLPDYGVIVNQGF